MVFIVAWSCLISESKSVAATRTEATSPRARRRACVARDLPRGLPRARVTAGTAVVEGRGRRPARWCTKRNHAQEDAMMIHPDDQPLADADQAKRRPAPRAGATAAAARRTPARGARGHRAPVRRGLAARRRQRASPATRARGSLSSAQRAASPGCPAAAKPGGRGRAAPPHSSGHPRPARGVPGPPSRPPPRRSRASVAADCSATLGVPPRRVEVTDVGAGDRRRHGQHHHAEAALGRSRPASPRPGPPSLVPPRASGAAVIIVP